MAKAIKIDQTDKEAVLKLIAQFSEFGATANGGVHRLATSLEDKGSRDFLCDWFDQNGFTTQVDNVGNIFGILELSSSKNDTAFFCGSHLDSQPNGGRFDGALGVAFGCIAALVAKKLINEGTIESQFGSFVVVCWTGEEGSRFQPSLLGSRVFAGAMDAEEALQIHDGADVSLKDALCKIGYLGSDIPSAPGRYLEVHIEQAVQLENAGFPIGIVTSCWGARKLKLTISGHADHTGPTPMDVRKDALLAASKLIVKVRKIADRSEQSLHSSVGRIETSPNSPNTVTDHVEIWVEFRSQGQDELESAEENLRSYLEAVTQETNCHIEIANREVRDVVTFDRDAVDLASSALQNVGAEYLSLTTIAGHDAVQLQSVCASTLLFIPSKDGISHAPEEFTSEEDICTGFDASIQVMGALLSNPVAGTISGGIDV